MKNLIPILLLAITGCATSTTLPAQPSADYTLVVEGFDWGAAASKVILDLPDSTDTFQGDPYTVVVTRSSHCAELPENEASGELDVLYSYISDDRGHRVAKGRYITLVLYVAPWESIGSPVKYYFNNPKCPGNVWIDFKLTVTNTKTGKIWNNEKERIIPLIDDFDQSGTFQSGDITLQYADYEPSNTNSKRPLIIWLHGGGEGGTVPSIPLIANRAANYAAPEIQNYFQGAYVLVPQSPTFWMDKGGREYTRGEVDDIYYTHLKALFDQYISDHPQIDTDRIYIGGCSNGGYMTVKLMMEYPEYFAAGFPSALAMHDEHITDDQLDRLQRQPIWFIHSADDPVTPADITVVPLYKRLIAAGAEDVHFSYYDHVIDITNQFGGDSYHYLGHFSWIYSHANVCHTDYDGSPVLVDDQPVTLMGWLARQRR